MMPVPETDPPIDMHGLVMVVDILMMFLFMLLAVGIAEALKRWYWRRQAKKALKLYDRR